ncbi:unannotated protein [freshwater metagenome]|uniref:Unannotated protein n=1 Tax=freshwater metagenome TaxID=449393 RepID=A0A6J7QIM7_9ZZZZ|nr:hypothetical protein [Actinomycetota bacterium]MSY42121.1 hypothetical protein [Actinomycetota bacterium]
MNRSTGIALVSATAGVLIAASIAGVVIINAASSPATADSIIITSAASAQSTTAPTLDANAPQDIVFSSPALPEIMINPPSPKANKSRDAATPAETPATTPAESPAANSASPSVRDITANDAAAIVLAASGGKATDAQQVTHGGYNAWAITVSRADGSVVKGFVEATSGVIFDWSVVSGPTQVAPSKNNGGEQDGEQNDANEHEGNEHEGGDDD